MPGLADAASQYDDSCAEANATLYRAVKAAVTTEQLEAAYADARRRLIGHG
jgi:hypothetical protein